MLAKEELKNCEGRRILLAEDCADSQLLLSHLLKSAGADVTCVNNGAECFDKALSAYNQHTPFDLILMDLQMPKMDGLSATAKLRDCGYDLPILAMTARSTPGDIEQSLKAGCNEHISKLSGPNFLMNEVKKQLRPKKVAKTELPALPVVPEALKENPGFAKLALESIERLPSLIRELETAIDQKELSKIRDLTITMGALSLYGYSIFSTSVQEIQLATENQDYSKLAKSLPSLRHAVDGIVAGRNEVIKIARSTAT